MTDRHREPGEHSPASVELQQEGLIADTDARWLADMLARLSVLALRGLARVTIRLVPDPEMCRLHAAHMNDPTTTDVLTFVDGDEVDIAVCVDEAMRRAAEMGHDLRRELLLYGLHGMLHAAVPVPTEVVPRRRMPLGSPDPGSGRSWSRRSDKAICRVSARS